MTAYKNKYTHDILVPIAKCFGVHNRELMFVFAVTNRNSCAAYEARRFREDFLSGIYLKIELDKNENIQNNLIRGVDMKKLYKKTSDGSTWECVESNFIDYRIYVMRLETDHSGRSSSKTRPEFDVLSEWQMREAIDREEYILIDK